MPWKETSPVTERKRFIDEYLTGEFTVTELCRRHGISRKPQQNGRHERMHLTLAQETAAPPSKSLKAQQRAFDRFRKEYNDDRPHEALGGNVPADYYVPSERPLPDPPWGRDFLYPDEFEIAQVSKLGYLQWDRRTWKVYFGRMLLGTLRRGPRGALRFTATTPSPPSMQ